MKRPSMGRRPRHDGDEEDVFSHWRHVLSSFRRAGATKKVKRRACRRERAEARRELRQ